MLIDFSNCSAREVEEIARRVPDYVTTQPAQSVLILTDFTGASFEKHALLAMKEAAVFDKPFVKKSAFIGSGSLPQGFYEQLRIYPRARPAGL